MMNIRNHVRLIGVVSAVPQLKTMENGTTFGRFVIAVNDTFVNKKGERVTDTYWHQIVAWGSLAQVAERILQKGTEVTVEGKLINRSWKDKTGAKHSSTEVVANELIVIRNNKAA